ncbi:M20/M25/M40 family metallo-hydrolase, partial [Acinetobacter baumannii]
GHIDVVPDGDRAQWEDDPFSGRVVDGKMYGRGVTDMKGGNVSLLLAMEALQSLGVRLKGDVIFQSVIEEESGGAGTLAAILRGYRADAA